MLYFYFSTIECNEDKEKFQYIFLKYEKQLFYRAYEIIKDKGLAEDAVQTIFLNLANNFEKVSKLDEEIIKARLYIMIKNTSINIIKKKKGSKEILFADLNAPLPNLNTDIENSIISNINYEKLIKAIYKLPEHYREVLYLEQVNDCSIKEIADILDLKYNTVQKRLIRAKMILQKKLREEDVIYG